MEDSVVKKARDLAAEALLEWDQKISAKDWKVEKDHHGIVISKSKIFTDKKRPPVWKLECVVEEDTARVLMMFKEPKVRRKWDKGFNDLTILERIDDEVCIARYMTNAIAVVSARDFVDARNVKIIKTGEVVTHFKMVGTSIQVDKYKPEKHFVRATTYSSGIQLDRVEVDGKGHTKILLMNQVDINGWVPVGVINSAMASTMYDMAHNIQKYAKDDSIFEDSSE
jgi:hypothetical protein